MAEKSIDARIKENDRKRVALDKQIAGLREDLAALNKEAQELSRLQQEEVVASLRSERGGQDGQANGATLTARAQ